MPYRYTTSFRVKGRWAGKTIYDVFVEDFPFQPAEYFRKAIDAGRITIDGKVKPSYVLKGGELITHDVHRHEYAVLSKPIEVIHQDGDFMVVDKPPSVPVHPCGRYRKNSVCEMLSVSGTKWHACHRLDRLTSGVLLLASSPDRAAAIQQQFQRDEVRKEYLARVVGVFPDTASCSESLRSSEGSRVVVDAKGKAAHTNFERLETDGEQSIVLCKPLTGRTHQIRVHLAHLGYPIVNDPLYGPKKEDRASLVDMGRPEEVDTSSLEFEVDEICAHCPSLLPVDPGDIGSEVFICLHAKSYRGKDWFYETRENPEWASLGVKRRKAEKEVEQPGS